MKFQVDINNDNVEIIKQYFGSYKVEIYFMSKKGDEKEEIGKWTTISGIENTNYNYQLLSKFVVTKKSPDFDMSNLIVPIINTPLTFNVSWNKNSGLYISKSCEDYNGKYQIIVLENKKR